MEPTTGGGVADRAGRADWWVVAAMAVVTFLAMLDATAVALALPTLVVQLDIAPGLGVWVLLAYMTPLVGLALPAGAWVDTVGHRSATLAAIAGFGTASLLVGLAPGAGTMIAGRALQGCFAALLLSLAPAVTVAAVPRELRGRAMGVIATVGPLGAVAGYAVGGVLLDGIGWRWVFLLNIPVCVATLTVAAARLSGRGQLRLPSGAQAREGAVLLVSAALILGGLTATAEWSTWGLAACVAAAAPIGLWARSRAGRPLLELVVSPRLRTPHVSLLVEAVAFGIAGFVLPFHLSHAGSASRVGLLLMLLPVMASILGPPAGYAVDRAGAAVVAATGAAVLALSLLLLAPADPGWESADLAWRLGLAGVGVGLFAGANQTLAMNAAPPDRLATIGATTNVVRQLGFAIGPALATAVWSFSDYARPGLTHALGLGSMLALASCLVLARESVRRRPVPDDHIPQRKAIP